MYASGDTFDHARVERDLGAAHRDHRHRLDAAREPGVDGAHGDAVGDDRRRLQPRRAEAVDGHGRHLVGQPGQVPDQAGHVQPLLALGVGAAEHEVLDASPGDLGAAQRLPDDQGAQIVGPGVAQVALDGAPDRGANR